MENAIEVKQPHEVPFSEWFRAVESARLKRLKPEPVILDGCDFGYYVGPHRIRLYPESTAVLYTVDRCSNVREYVADSPGDLTVMLEIVDRLDSVMSLPDENMMAALVKCVSEFRK